MFPWIEPWPWCGTGLHPARYVLVLLVMVIAVVLAFHGETAIMIVSSSLLLLAGSVMFLRGVPSGPRWRGELGDAG